MWGLGEWCWGARRPSAGLPRPGRAEGSFTHVPRPWSPCSCNDLGSHGLDPREKCPTLGLSCLFLFSAPARICSGSLSFLSLSWGVWRFPLPPPFCSPEEDPEVACPLLSHTHTLSLSPSLSSLQTQLWSSATTAAGKPALPPHSYSLPCLVLPSPTRHPPVPEALPCHVGPGHPQGPMSPPCGPCFQGCLSPLSHHQPPAGPVLSPRDHEWGSKKKSSFQITSVTLAEAGSPGGSDAPAVPAPLGHRPLLEPSAPAPTGPPPRLPNGEPNPEPGGEAPPEQVPAAWGPRLRFRVVKLPQGLGEPYRRPLDVCGCL